MSSSYPLRLLPPGATPGGAVILRPDFAARRRGEARSPERLAVQAEALFARKGARHRAEPAKPGAAEAALAALAAGVEIATRPAAAPVAHPARKAARRLSPAFVDPSAGLAALSASLAAVTHPQAAL